MPSHRSGLYSSQGGGEGSTGLCVRWSGPWPPQPKRPLLHGLLTTYICWAAPTHIKKGREEAQDLGEGEGRTSLRESSSQSRRAHPARPGHHGSSLKPWLGYHLHINPGTEGAALLKLSPPCGPRTRGLVCASSLGMGWADTGVVQLWANPIFGSQPLVWALEGKEWDILVLR